MFVELILYNCYKSLRDKYKSLRDKYKSLRDIPKKDYITLAHTFFYYLLVTLPVYYEYYNSFYTYFTLIYTQWIILGGCIIRGDKTLGEPCDFVRTLYILGIFENHQYQDELTYLSDIFAVPSYIYCGFKAGYGLKSFIYPIIFITKFNKRLHTLLLEILKVY